MQESSKQMLTPCRRRQLDDEELDSGDDLDQTDRIGDEPEQEYMAQEKVTMDLEIPRQAIPEPSDGEVCISLATELCFTGNTNSI